MSAVTCGSCLQRTPAFDGILTPYLYQPPVSNLIVALKYRHRLAAGRTLGQLLAGHVAKVATPLPELIIPVPLHPRRLRERGFNQASELARSITRELAVPLSPESLQRIKRTTAQAGLKRRQRLRNLADAFAYHEGTPRKHVAIVDDVVTTGATAEALARILKRAGIARVDVWAVARTP